MGEVTTPGCLAGSIEALSAASDGTAVSIDVGGSDEAATTCVWRATRTRCPSRSNSISVSPVSSSRRASSRISSWSTAGFCLGMSLPLRSLVTASALLSRVDQRGQAVDCERVAGNPETAQARFCHRRDVRQVAEALACENIADVDLDDRQLDRRDRV